jgi:hypothetical protein
LTEKSALTGFLKMQKDNTSPLTPIHKRGQYPPPSEGLGEVILSSSYLAPIQYYSKLANFPVCIEQHCNYVKQTYRNRCIIASANGIMPLTIPVDKDGKEKCLTRDIRISTHEDWQTLHWRAIVSAYNSTPFFEYYEDDLRPFYEKRWDYLFDFNNEIQQKIIELLDIDVNISFTEEYKTDFSGGEIDFREAIHPKKNLEDPNFKLVPYYQVFEHKFGFLPNLSIIDLLFNMGNEAFIVIKG